MSQETPAEDALSLEELSEVLADATGETPEDIEQGARDVEIGSPWEAEATEFDEPGPLDQPSDE